jgi:hypothetical protein
MELKKHLVAEEINQKTFRTKLLGLTEEEILN